jgi:fatty-acyl-CoA synthase
MKQLLITDILNYASKFHSNTELVSCHISGENGVYSNLFYQRYTYEIFNKRCKKFGNMINKLYLQKNDEINQIIIGTLITNNLNHLEICYGTICLGQIFQPINYNLDKENIRYVINHSKVCIIFYERCFESIVQSLKTKCKNVKIWICIEDNYEKLLEYFNSELEWNNKLDEKTIAILLYTNGISSKPLGVQLTHREIILSSMSSIAPDAMGISATDNILTIPNLYSACSWNSIFFIPLTGAKLVLIDDYCIKDSFFDLFCDIIEKEQINTSLGPPTFWSYFLEYIKKNKYDTRFCSLFLSKVIT